jgi:signal transduction histidine kinase
MPIAKRNFIRATIFAILVGMAALLSSVGVTLYLVSQTRQLTDTVNATRAMRAATVALRGFLLDAETGQRGYLLTNNREYLAPYNNARRLAPAQITALHKTLDKDPDLAPLATKLDELLIEKYRELQQTIELMDKGDRQGAIALVEGNRGREIMDRAREVFDQIVGKVEERIVDNLARQREAMASLQMVSILGAALVVLVLGTYTMIVLRYTRELTAAEAKVHQLNVGLEERIAERTADLAQANEEIQRFAYIVTHDLRAPLVNIMGFTSELESSVSAVKAYIEQEDPAQREAALPSAKIAATEDLPEAITFIRSSTRKMDGLINAILKLSREGRRTLTPVLINLEALLQAAVGSVRHQVLEAGGEITVSGQVASLVSDRMGVDQIIGNLLDNAIKYRALSRPLRIHIRVRDSGTRMVMIEIEDNGRGIAPQDHERIFDLFRRSGAQDQAGEGIGLAHVRAMARNLGGNITVKSELDRGSVFTVMIADDLRRVIQKGTA